MVILTMLYRVILLYVYLLPMKQFLPDVADRGEEKSPVGHDEVVGSAAAAAVLVVDAPLLDDDPRLAGLVQEDAEVRGRPRDEPHLHAHEQPQGEGHRVRHKVQLWKGIRLHDQYETSFVTVMSCLTFGLPHGEEDVDVDGEYHGGDDDGGEGAGGDVGKVGREEGAAMME